VQQSRYKWDYVAFATIARFLTIFQFVHNCSIRVMNRFDTDKKPIILIIIVIIKGAAEAPLDLGLGIDKLSLLQVAS